MMKGIELKEKALAALEDKKQQIRESSSYKNVMALFEESAEQGYMERGFSHERMVELFGADYLKNFDLLTEVFANDGITLTKYYNIYTFSWEGVHDNEQWR